MGSGSSKLLAMNMPPVNKHGLLGMLSGAGGGTLPPEFYSVLARKTGTSTTITTDDFTANQNLLILMDTHSGSSPATACYQFNEDSDNDYCNRFSTNGGSDNTTQVNKNRILNGSGYANREGFAVGFVGDIPDQEKLVTSFACESGGVGANTPDRREISGKYVQTGAGITNATLFEQDGNGWGASSEIVVLGTVAGANTSFEQLDQVSGDGTSDTMDTGTFTAKKYLYFEAFCDVGASGTMDNMGLRFNGDSTSNYSYRSNVDGSEGTSSNADYMRFGSGSATGYSLFTSGFIVNNASVEKLCIIMSSRIRQSGSATSPISFELYSKWRNTSDQITSLQVKNDEDNWTDKSKLTVWGFD